MELTMNDSVSSNSLNGLKRAKEFHVERMHKDGTSHPCSTNGFILSSMQWAISKLEEEEKVKPDGYVIIDTDTNQRWYTIKGKGFWTRKSAAGCAWNNQYGSTYNHQKRYVTKGVVFKIMD